MITPMKFRAIPCIRNGEREEYVIMDAITRERFPCDNEHEFWETFDRIQAKGTVQ